MKTRATLTFLLLSFVFHTSSKAQNADEMILVGNKISYKSLTLSIKDARELSKHKSPLAYENFRKAQKMYAWNIAWSAIGGYEIGAGLIQATLNENPIGFLDMPV